MLKEVPAESGSLALHTAVLFARGQKVKQSMGRVGVASDLHGGSF